MRTSRHKLTKHNAPATGPNGRARALTVETFDDLSIYAEHSHSAPEAPHIFMLPRWMQTWRQSFTPNDELHICVIKKQDTVIGVAPLAINDAVASFVGDPEVFDYMDFSAAPGYEREFFHALLDHLARRRIMKLDLRCLRPESPVFPHLSDAVSNRNGSVSIEPDGVTLEMDLPDDWNKYLEGLAGKARHEVRRKLRRLHGVAETNLLVVEEPDKIAEQTDTFLKMFRESRPDKAAFMNPPMESFFRSFMRTMSEERILRLFVLTLRDSPVAAALCFDYRDTVYLYNSGYDPRYSSLSAGLLCKILSIRHSIGIRRKKYDFLKGAEAYKYQLGGKEVHLSRCRAVLE